jgi:ribonuclease HII
VRRFQTLRRFDEGVFSRFPEAGLVAGVDEAGRGPLAGPVVAAAVIFRRKVSLSKLDDSKKLTAKTRERLFKEIVTQALVGIGRVSESVIDEINILQATRLAMREAILALPRTPGLILIDGTQRLDLPLPQLPVIGGDGRSAVVAAASIIAKVFRDHWMRELDESYPGYGFRVHKGYPTPEHLRTLDEKGASPVHRKTFRPVRESVEEFFP